jgi:hypothetical protein
VAHVTLCLRRGALAAAAVDSLTDAPPEVEIVDFENYVKITATESIQLDLDAIGDRLGRVLTMAEFLGSMSTFIGRVVVAERTFAVCSHGSWEN